jgi:hypothetical protein
MFPAAPYEIATGGMFPEAKRQLAEAHRHLALIQPRRKHAQPHDAVHRRPARHGGLLDGPDDIMHDVVSHRSGRNRLGVRCVILEQWN